MEKNTNTANTVASKAKKNKKPGFFAKTWGKIKEIFSELKKVTWPSFATVVKQLGCVLAIVVIVLVIIMLFDLGLTQLLNVVKGTAEVASTLGVL